MCTQTPHHVRQAEFASACLKPLLDANARHSTPHYVGFMRHDQYEDVTKMIRSELFSWWDGSSLAPPKTRPRDESTRPQDQVSLEILAFQNGSPIFPSSLLQKFPSGSREHQELMAMQAQLQQEFPSAAETPARDAEARVDAGCDYPSGERPISLQRVLSLPHIRAADFNVERLLSCDCI